MLSILGHSWHIFAFLSSPQITGHFLLASANRSVCATAIILSIYHSGKNFSSPSRLLSLCGCRHCSFFVPSTCHLKCDSLIVLRAAWSYFKCTAGIGHLMDFTGVSFKTPWIRVSAITNTLALIVEFIISPLGKEGRAFLFVVKKGAKIMSHEGLSRSHEWYIFPYLMDCFF